tara:strand:+ start:347 stop:580 length:234 start_codon:yes stop_codon:yes gene_type:complete
LNIARGTSVTCRRKKKASKAKLELGLMCTQEATGHVVQKTILEQAKTEEFQNEEIDVFLMHDKVHLTPSGVCINHGL